MDAKSYVDIAMGVLAPVLTAVLGIAALAVGDWRQRRTEVGRRRIAFDDASRQVAFAAEWWSARKELAGSTDAEERAMKWLEEAAAQVSASPAARQQAREVTLSRLFLVHPLRRRLARTLRLVFYTAMSVFLFAAGNFIDTALHPELNGASGAWYVSDLILIGSSIVVALIARTFALGHEHRAPSDGLSVRRVLLFRRLHRPAARVVRVFFVMWLAQLALSFFAYPFLLLENVSTFTYTAYLVVGTGIGLALRQWAISLESARSLEDHPADNAGSRAADAIASPARLAATSSGSWGPASP